MTFRAGERFPCPLPDAAPAGRAHRETQSDVDRSERFDSIRFCDAEWMDTPVSGAGDGLLSMNAVPPWKANSRQRMATGMIDKDLDEGSLGALRRLRWVTGLPVSSLIIQNLAFGTNRCFLDLSLIFATKPGTERAARIEPPFGGS